MSFLGHPGSRAIIIDLTTDDINVSASGTTGLASVDTIRGSFHAIHEQGVKVEDGSSTLVGTSTPDSGESSPKSQQDNDITQTESNPAECGELSPRNAQIQGDGSSDDGLSLVTILTRSKKRKHDSPGLHTFESKSIHMSSPLATKALGSLVGPQSLKPDFNNFFSVRKRVEKVPHFEESQQRENQTTTWDEPAKVQEGRQLAKNTNSQILNIDRDEVFGREKKKKNKHRSGSGSQKQRAKQPDQVQMHSQVDGQAFSALGPRRAASGAPETIRPTNKTGGSQFVKPPEPREEFESQRPHKRRKHGVRDDTASGPTSLAPKPITTRSQVASVDRSQGHRSCGKFVQASRPRNRGTTIEKPKGSIRHQPGDPRSNRVQKLPSYGRRRKLMEAMTFEKAQKSKNNGPGRKRGQTAYLVADRNEQGQWAPSGCQSAGLASQKPLERESGQKGGCDKNSVLRKTREERYDIDSDPAEAQLPMNSKATHAQLPLRLQQGMREAQGMPHVDLHQPGKVLGNDDQQKTRRIQSGLNAVQPAHRVSQLRQTMRLDEKDLEDAKAFFSNHPSQLAQQRKTTFADYIPPDVGKPSYPDRCLATMRSNGGTFGRKRPTAIQANKKRTTDRVRQIRNRREQLKEQVNKEFPDESEESKERRIEAGLAKLRDTHAKNDEKREAQKAEGLLTVKYIEDSESVDGNAIDEPATPSTKGKRRGIPLAQALEPGATITVYAVFKSEPYEKGEHFGNYKLSRMEDQFFEKEDANKHAEAVLRDDRYDGSHLVSIQFGVGPDDGLFFGTKGLANDKLVMCMVQKERQMSSDLDLRGIFVHKELKQIYRSRYDVFLVYVIPRVFLDAEETGNDKRKSKDKNSKSKTTTTGVVEDSTESGEKEGVDGASDNDSLFSGPPTPDTESDYEEKVEVQGDEECDESDESDAVSVDTDVTLEASQPGGELDSLSWNDVDYVHEIVGSFTVLELANKEAIKVALERWKPRGARLDAWLDYRDSIKPSLNEAWSEEMDLKTAEIKFTVPEFEGHVRDRPWPFIHSLVRVEETRLQGPRDIGGFIVKGNGGGDRGQSSEEDGEDGEEDGEDD